MSYAQITIVGRLGKDPEVRQTQTGKELVTSSVAVGKDEKTTWFNIAAWERTGSWLKDARKGDMVFVQGALELKTYQNKSGHFGIDASVNAQVIRAMKSQSTGSQPQYSGQTSSVSNVADFDAFADIPFHHEPRRIVKGDFDAVTRTL